MSRAVRTPTLIRRMSARRKWLHFGIVVIVIVGGARGESRAVAGPRLAQAQDPASKVTQMNREALAAIDKREFEKARELLKKALDFCQASGLAQHPVAARTHVHMGVVIIEGFKNRELGMKQFAEALAIAPGIALTPSLATPELNEAFDEAKAGGGGGPMPSSAETGLPPAPAREDRPAGESSPRPPVSSSGFTYHTVSAVKQGNAIRITVNVDEGLKFHKVVLAYRPQGTSEFLGRQMDPVGAGAYSAEIPDHATTGSSVAYYIEAEDDDGQPVAARGTEERPLVIQLGADPHASADRPHETVEKHAEEKSTSSEEGEEDEGGPRWFASLEIGSGAGYTSGSTELNLNGSVPGTFSGALIGQVVPEFGYWYRRDLLLSGQGRIQIVNGPTEYVDPATGHVYNDVGWALALFAKATWLFGSDDFRPFLSAGLGGGQIRHVITYSSLDDCGASRNQKCVDTVVAGPVLAEGGGGFFYRLGPSFSLMLSSNVELAAPKFTVNVDLDAGLAFNF
jgi:hypothetical protein